MGLHDWFHIYLSKTTPIIQTSSSLSYTYLMKSREGTADGTAAGVNKGNNSKNKNNDNSNYSCSSSIKTRF